MDNRIEKDVIVIGAGLTGLTTAFYLNKFGKSVAVLEKSSATGGVINTGYEDGFIYEMGPNSGVLGSAEAVELFEDLGDSGLLETARKESKKRLIWKGNSWQALPSGPLSAVTTPLFSWKDKFRILGEPFRAKGTNPNESVSELVRRRLGNSFLNYAVDPFISGIYAGNPDTIIPKYALPKLYDLEQDYGSFIKGSFAKMKNTDPRAKKATREVFSAKNGLKNLTLALTKQTGNENIFLNSENIQINPAENGFNISCVINGKNYEFFAKKVVTTCGAYALKGILPFVPAPELEEITNLRYAKVVQAIIGFKIWNGIALDAFGGLVPSIEKRKVLGVLYSSSIFKDRAPAGGALLSVFIGGMKFPEAYTMTDKEITDLVSMEIKIMMGLKTFEPDLFKIFRYPTAIPQYEISSGQRFRRIEIIESNYTGFILAGNIRNGIGMSDRIKQARNIAESLK